MSKKRCMACDQIKSLDLFHNKHICLNCIPTKKKKTYERNERCKKCLQKVMKVDEQLLCKKCALEESKSLKVKLPVTDKDILSRIRKVKKEMANIIISLSSSIEVNDIPGFEDLSLKGITRNELMDNYTVEDLANLIGVLEYMYLNIDN